MSITEIWFGFFSFFTSFQQVLEIQISYELYDDGEGSPECEFIPKSLPKQTESTDSEKKVSSITVIKVFFINLFVFFFFAQSNDQPLVAQFVVIVVIHSRR